MARGAVSRVLYALVTMAVGFFMMPFLVSHLGRELYGIWVTITSLVNNFYLLDFGFATGVMRSMAVGLGTHDARLVAAG